VRIRGYTFCLNDYITVRVRVCGQETLVLNGANPRVYTLGYEGGDKSTMTDEVRYLTIEQSEFETWYTLNAGSDPCDVNDFFLFIDLSPLTYWPLITDPQVDFPGTFGSISITIDRTEATNTKTMYLRARTIGLVTRDQTIQFSVCDTTGSLTITKPVSSMYVLIDQHAAGNSAVFNFAQWSISDIWDNCAKFWKYGVVAASDPTHLEAVRYPKTGVVFEDDCIYSIGNCK